MSRWKQALIVLAASLLTLLIGATCANAQAAAGDASASMSGTAAGPVYEYRLGAGDKIRVIVFGEEDLSGEFSVSGDGKVSLPLIGDIPAQGATASVMQDRIASALANGYLKSPKVSVEILTYRPFYIMGEVNKPGEYPYSSGMTVDRAVAIASGYTYRANQKKVYIKHAGSDAETEVPLDSPVLIQPGDTIRVAERYF